MQLENIVSENSEPLLKAALSLGFSKDESFELVQSVWLTFLQVKDKFQYRSTVKTFLFGILYNKVLELRRQTKYTQNHDPIDDILNQRFDAKGHWINPPLSPFEHLEQSQLIKIIRDCIDRLPLNQRMAFSLKEIDEESSEEICNILEVSVTNLGVLLFRARNRLRECVEKKGI